MSRAMSVEDPQGAEALRHLDMVKFKEGAEKEVSGGTRVQSERMGGSQPEHGGPGHGEDQEP